MNNKIIRYIEKNLNKRVLIYHKTKGKIMATATIKHSKFCFVTEDTILNTDNIIKIFN